MILVGIGGFFGALIRFSIGKYIVSSYPWATFMINCSGSFALGFLYGLQPIEWLWQLLGIGFLGAYTTFSTFGFEVLQLLEKHQWLNTVTYIFSSVILGILCAALGLFMA
ncbi:fluoride efflux transporter CrcB [Lysinibacillus sp. NPDC097287]|uniref:fluoride efflux transporter CrcB n=1 Tax=Lysinibacillus sp. NPDC097287 TaxID=3364144 RepID=UPI00382B03D8